MGKSLTTKLLGNLSALWEEKHTIVPKPQKAPLLFLNVCKDRHKVRINQAEIKEGSPLSQESFHFIHPFLTVLVYISFFLGSPSTFLGCQFSMHVFPIWSWKARCRRTITISVVVLMLCLTATDRSSCCTEQSQMMMLSSPRCSSPPQGKSAGLVYTLELHRLGLCYASCFCLQRIGEPLCQNCTGSSFHWGEELHSCFKRGCLNGINDERAFLTQSVNSRSTIQALNTQWQIPLRI